MLRVGLTGGIACGKSTIGAMMVARGAHLLHADTLAHRLYEPGTPTYDEIVRRFGREILNQDATINRSRLANLVFPDRITELNAITHPAVLEAQNRWMADLARQDPQGIAIVEAALLLEAGAAGDFDKIIVVTCDTECKVDRLGARNQLPFAAARAEVERRSAAQWSDEEKARHADYVIDNSGSLSDAEAQVDKIWLELQQLATES